MKDLDKVVFDYIIKFKRQHNGNSPSLQKIVEGTGILLMSVWRATKRLEEDNLLNYNKASGGFIIPDSSWKFDGDCNDAS